MIHKSYLFIIFICISAGIFCSCDQKPVSREYTEIAISSPQRARTITPQSPHPFIDQNSSMMEAMKDPNMRSMIDASVAQVPLQWKTPKGWQENKGTGMRLASFTTTDTDPINCTIIALGGGAGGIQANVTRWIRQLGLNDISQEELKNFLESSTTINSKGTFEGTAFDFTKLQAAKNNPESMMAAIYMINNQSVFVKMTGTYKAIQEHKSEFINLCKSLE